MAKKKKIYDDDDGRSFADMSGVERRNLMSFTIHGQTDKEKQNDNRPKNEHSEPIFTREERRWYILGALKSALLIGAAFIFGLGLFILLMYVIWNIGR